MPFKSFFFNFSSGGHFVQQSGKTNSFVRGPPKEHLCEIISN